MDGWGIASLTVSLVQLLLTVGILWMMIKRINLLEDRMAGHGQSIVPIFVNGQNRQLITPISAFIKDTGTMELFNREDIKKLNLGPEFAGVKFKLYAVADE